MSVNQKIELSTGQTLGYLELGNPRGEACFYFHGFPGSSKQILLIRKMEVLDRFRVIAIDRPGFGYSTFHKKRKLAEIAEAVRELADHLGIEKFHLVAVSGGSPSAFVAADRLRERVLSLTSICGLGPLHDKEYLSLMHPAAQTFLRVGKASPMIASQFLARAHMQISKGRAVRRENLEKWLSPADADVVMDSTIRDLFRESMGHAFHQGAYGPALELKIFQEDWGISNWSFPFPVRLWHGTKDRIVPPDHSALLAKKIPGAELHLIENEGHYSLPIHRIDEILAPLR